MKLVKRPKVLSPDSTQVNIKAMIIIRNREKYFSSSEEYNSYLEERRYNIVSDLYYSGLKRAYKKNVGRLRSKAADYLSKKTVEEVGNHHSALKKFMFSPKVKNEEVKKEVIKIATKDGDTRISRLKLDNMGGAYAGTNETLRPIFNGISREGIKQLNRGKDYRKAIRSLYNDKYKHQVFIPKGNGVDDLAHEIGHVENSKSKGLRKLINKVANSPETRRELNEDHVKLMYTGNNGKSGIKTALKDYGKSLLISQEEKNASRAGRKMMEQAGASKEELRKAKEHHDAGVKTYKFVGKSNLYNTLKNTIQIPSRKSETVLINSDEARKKARRLKIKEKKE